MMLSAEPSLVGKLGGPYQMLAALPHALEHYAELQEAVPAAEALQMLQTVQREVRAEHSRRVGAPRDCPPAAEKCACCWHAEFVGGGRTRGRAGHDVDILLWHATEHASRGDAPQDYVLLTLVAVLEAQGRLVTKHEGYQSVILTKHRQRQPAPDGVRPYMRSASMRHGISYGVENLSDHDHHDKVFGVWRTAAGRHHRIDIVVVAHPEEIGFARLAWTGSRTLNRLLRLRAIDLGLNLGPHGLTARDQREVVIDARQSPPLTVTVPTLGVVPFHHVRTEEQIIRVMANGTDAFKALYSPLNRNA